MMMISNCFYLTHIICILSFSYLFCRFTFLQVWPHTSSPHAYHSLGTGKVVHLANNGGYVHEDIGCKMSD